MDDSIYDKAQEALDDGATTLEVSKEDLKVILGAINVEARVETALSLREGWFERELRDLSQNVLEYENPVRAEAQQKIADLAVEINLLKRVLRG